MGRFYTVEEKLGKMAKAISVPGKGMEFEKKKNVILKFTDFKL